MSARSGIGTRSTAPRAATLAGPSLSALALVLALAALALAGCANRVRVTIVNDSGAPLSELRVAAGADSTGVAPVPPGDSAVARVRVRGEDEVVLRGRVGGRPLSPMMPVYAESGYRLRLVVDSTGFVGVADLRTGY